MLQSFVRQIVSSIATYLVVLVQFKMNEDQANGNATDHHVQYTFGAGMRM